MTPAKIMIVEVETIIAADIASRITKLGYHVCAKVPSGEKAIEMAAVKAPDLVLMDIVLKGGMDGIEAADIIRSSHRIPIIFLTAYADEEKLERAKGTMPFGYILKPFQDRDLKVTIEMAMYMADMDVQRRQLEDRLQRSLATINRSQQAAHIGSWERNLKTGDGFWSDEHYRLFGYAPGEVKQSHQLFRPIFYS